MRPYIPIWRHTASGICILDNGLNEATVEYDPEVFRVEINRGLLNVLPRYGDEILYTVDATDTVSGCVVFCDSHLDKSAHTTTYYAAGQANVVVERLSATAMTVKYEIKEWIEMESEKRKYEELVINKIEGKYVLTVRDIGEEAPFYARAFNPEEFDEMVQIYRTYVEEDANPREWAKNEADKITKVVRYGAIVILDRKPDGDIYDVIGNTDIGYIPPEFEKTANGN